MTRRKTICLSREAYTYCRHHAWEGPPMTRSHNHDRAASAAVAIDAFRRQTGADAGDEAVHDLIADLGHYARRNKLDFLPLVARALSTWAAELECPDGIDAGPGVYIRVGNETTLLKHGSREGGAP